MSNFWLLAIPSVVASIIAVIIVKTDLIRNVLIFVNTYNGFFSLLATLILAGITYFYAKQTQKQAYDAHEMVLQTEKRTKQEAEDKENTKMNFIHLINCELAGNNYAVVTLLFFAEQQNSDLNYHKIVSLYFDSLKNSIWNLIGVEAARIFENHFMQIIIGYYTGLNSLKLSLATISMPPVTNTDIEALKKGLKSLIIIYSTCIELFEQEIGQLEFKALIVPLGDKKVSFNPKTGDLIYVPNN